MVPLSRTLHSSLLSFVGGMASFSSTILAVNGYLAWIPGLSPSFCCLIDFWWWKAGTPSQRHDNGFLSCLAPPRTVYDLRLGRELLNNCTTPVPNTLFGWGGLVSAASIFCCAPSEVSSCHYKLIEYYFLLFKWLLLDYRCLTFLIVCLNGSGATLKYYVSYSLNTEQCCASQVTIKKVKDCQILIIGRQNLTMTLTSFLIG